MEKKEPRINYIKQINGYWNKILNEGPLKNSSIGVYFALLDRNNRYDWKAEFTVDYEIVMEMASISKNTYYQCLKELTERNFIKYIRSENRALLGKISIIPLYQNLVHEDDSNYETSLDTSYDSNDDSISTLNKQLNNEIFKQEKQTNISNGAISSTLDKTTSNSMDLKRKEKNSAKKEREFTEILNESLITTRCHFSSAFEGIWSQLIRSPKWANKSQEAINKSLEKLMRYEESFAINQVECAIASEWQGVVFTNTDTEYAKYINQKKSNGFSDTSRGVQAALKVAEVTMRDD